MARIKLKFDIVDLINRFKSDEISFEEVYQEINKSELYKPKYAVELLIDKDLIKTGKIGCEDRDRLIQLVKKDDDEINRYLKSKCGTEKEKEELVDMLVEHDSYYLNSAADDRYCLLYMAKKITKESYIEC